MPEKDARGFSPQMQIIVISVSTVVYVIGFFPLYQVLGISAGVLAMIPITAAGWLMGILAGWTAAMIALPLNSLLLNLSGVPGWDVMLRYEGGAGFITWIMLLVTGLVIGRIHDLDVQMKKELSARKKAEEKFTNIAEDWSRTFDAMSDGISIHSPNFEILEVNSALCEMLGRRREELIGKMCYQMFHDKNLAIVNCPLEQTKVSKQKESIEIYEPHLNAWLHITCAPLFDKDQKLERIVHVVRNITESRGAAEELKKEKEELQRFHDLVVDRELKMIELKKEIEELKLRPAKF